MAATGELSCPIKARMQPLNLLTGHVELQVLALLDELKGGEECHPCRPAFIDSPLRARESISLGILSFQLAFNSGVLL